ncbi:MAG: hypothetical protein K2O89_07840 [Clostridia bacterium]|nr:hypothetical protein [Clostridia bacterium]
MKKLSATETINYLIQILIYYLETSEEEKNLCDGSFVLGERTAYVECLEILQFWEHAHKNGLDFDIEARYPI